MDKDQLKIAREEIDRVDREMAALFERRMAAVAMVADYKRKNGLPVFDPEREEAVVAKNTAYITDGELTPFYVSFMRDTMKASRQYQRKKLTGMRVAYSGIEGAFAAIATHKIFPDAESVPYADFGSAYAAAESGECDVAVLPMENSTAGEVGQVVDLMYAGSLVVTGVYSLSVRHCLMGLPEAELSDVTRVTSHPQALLQCAPFIEARHLDTLDAVNTALAARTVAEGGDPTVAAIASEETAALYGLKILAPNINQTILNTTRFAVLARAGEIQGQGGKHFILLFTVRNEAGFLARAINVIGDHGYNMRCLRSRPMKDILWQYYFYAELEGDLETENGRKMLAELSEYCEKLKVVGSFADTAPLN